MDTSLFSSDSDRVCGDRDEDLQQSVDLITGDLNRKLDLESNHDSTPQLLPDSDVHEGFEDEDHNDNDNDDDDDFTFMYIGDKDSPKVFEDGQIWPVFPLFDQNLLLGGEYEVEEIDRLPVHPTVDKIFIESPRGRHHPPSTASENDDSAAGPFCVWSKESGTTTGTAELSKKSNSTGFSKLWRIREKVGRSNSDGRDAFVFLKSSDRTTTTSSSSSASSLSSVKPAVNAAGEKSKQGTKAKKPTISPLEAYLRSKERQTEEERRRTHLPYRPKHTGFFTNVHGGLSKNVHPY